MAERIKILEYPNNPVLNNNYYCLCKVKECHHEDFIGACYGFMDSVEGLCEEVEMVRGFCYLVQRVNAGGGCEAAVIARARISWVKFRECRDQLLNSKRFSLKLKAMVYQSCVRSAML